MALLPPMLRFILWLSPMWPLGKVNRRLNSPNYRRTGGNSDFNFDRFARYFRLKNRKIGLLGSIVLRSKVFPTTKCDSGSAIDRGQDDRLIIWIYPSIGRLGNPCLFLGIYLVLNVWLVVEEMLNHLDEQENECSKTLWIISKIEMPQFWAEYQSSERTLEGMTNSLWASKANTRNQRPNFSVIPCPRVNGFVHSGYLRRAEVWFF
jgi:hypothetical protein